MKVRHEEGDFFFCYFFLSNVLQEKDSFIELVIHYETRYTEVPKGKYKKS